MSRTSIIGMAVLCLVLVGCGDSRTVPVEGKIVWMDGSPANLTGYEVEAAVAKSRVGSRGEIQADGSFRLSTYSKDDGAEPGLLEVAIKPIPRTEIDPPPAESIPLRYQSRETSGLTIQAERGQRATVTFTLDRK